MASDVALDLSPDEVAQLLDTGFGIVPDETDIVSAEVATVCRLRVGSRMLAFKAMPGSAEDARLFRWQAETMASLAGRGLPVPALVPTSSGDTVHEAAVHGTRAAVMVTDWLAGPTLAEVEVDRPLLEAVGETAGRVSVALADAAPPPVPVEHPWELTRSVQTIRTALRGVSDARLRVIADQVVADFGSAVQPLLTEVPWSVIHHDLHDGNLLVGTPTGARRQVTGILDFGDLTHGPRITECVVAAAYAARNTDDPEHAVERVVVGWNRVRPLAPDEVPLLLPAVRTRLTVNAVVWAARAGGSRADYAWSRSQGTRDTLERLLAADPRPFADRLVAACSADTG